jgi:hypothetical protein
VLVCGDLRGGWALGASYRDVAAARAQWLNRLDAVRADHDMDRHQTGGSGDEVSGGGGGGGGGGDPSQHPPGTQAGNAAKEAKEAGEDSESRPKNLAVELSKAAHPAEEAGGEGAATIAGEGRSHGGGVAPGRPPTASRRRCRGEAEGQAERLPLGLEGRLSADGGPVVTYFRHEWVALRDPRNATDDDGGGGGGCSGSRRGSAPAVAAAAAEAKRVHHRCEDKSGARPEDFAAAKGDRGDERDRSVRVDGDRHAEAKGGSGRGEAIPGFKENDSAGAKAAAAARRGDSRAGGKQRQGRGGSVAAPAPSRWPAECLALPHPDGCDGSTPRSTTRPAAHRAVSPRSWRREDIDGPGWRRAESKS